MGLFGKDKKVDTSQAPLIATLQNDISNCWAWIQHLNKNQEILIKNSNTNIEKHKRFAQDIQQLQAKDVIHDQKDAEIEAVIKGIRDMAKTVETASATTEG